MVETKVFALSEFKVDGEDAGSFEGYASRFGTIDSYGDTIDRGAYAETIPEFLTRGFLGWGHDWTNPVGYFTEAEERTSGLYVKGRFHSDPQAQVYRQRVKERSDAGKFMGMSIGFTPQDYEFREVDGREIRALTRISLHEVSLVTVPAEHDSQITRVKSAPIDLPTALRAALSESDEAQLSALLEVIEEVHPQLKELLAQGAVVIDDEAAAEPELDPVTKALINRHLELVRMAG